MSKLSPSFTVLTRSCSRCGVHVYAFSMIKSKFVVARVRHRNLGSSRWKSAGSNGRNSSRMYRLKCGETHFVGRYRRRNIEEFLL